MTTDPYASPADAAVPSSRDPLYPVAITLMVMSGLWMLICLFAVAAFVIAAANTSDSGLARMHQMNAGTFLTCFLYQLPLLSGAMSMIRKSSYIWAFVTCWLACVPAFSPCYLLAIPVGVWGLVVMWRPQTRKLFPPTPAARDSLLGVAIGLIALAVMGIFFALFGINYFVSLSSLDFDGAGVPPALSLIIVMICYQFALIYGAASMFGAGTYRAAVVTCCLACVPICGPCYFFAIPVGIWGLIVLRRPEVRAGFA